MPNDKDLAGDIQGGLITDRELFRAEVDTAAGNSVNTEHEISDGGDGYYYDDKEFQR